MPEPTSALTIEGLILRIAREIGVAEYGSTGQGIATVPVEPHDLDMCRRIVYDGINTFIAASPLKGWRWMRRIMSVTMTATRVTGAADAADSTSLTDLTLADTYDDDTDLVGWYIYVLSGTGEGSYAQVTGYTAVTGKVTVTGWLDARGNTGGTAPAATDTFAITPVETVGGEIHRYPLDENFGGSADGVITYTAGTNRLIKLDWVDESFIRKRRATVVNTGYPLYAATKPLEPYASGAGPSRRFELLFSPNPTADDTVEFPYSVYFDQVQLEAGEASGGSGTTLVNDSLANLYPDDYYNDWVMKITDGTGKNSYAIVTDYEGSTGTFTVADWLAINGTAGGVDPAAESTYILQPVSNFHPAGMRFDKAIISACLAEAEEQVDELAGRGFINKFRNIDLPDAYKIDLRSAPRSLGTSNKSGKGRGGLILRPRTDVTFG
jgi:hypothetical protein